MGAQERLETARQDGGVAEPDDGGLKRLVPLAQTLLGREVAVWPLAQAFSELDEDNARALAKAGCGAVVRLEGGRWQWAVPLAGRESKAVRVLLVPRTQGDGGPLEQQRVAQLAAVADGLLEAQQLGEALRDREALLAVVEELTGVGWWRLREGDQSVLWSTGMAWLHGYEAGEPVSLEQALAPYDEAERAQIETQVRRTLETGEGYRLELQLEAPGADVRTVMTQSRIERDASGEVTGLVGVFQDFTAQAQLVRRLKQNESRYRLLAEHVSDVITRVNLDGTSKYISPAIKALLGWTIEEMTGRALDYVHPDDREKVRRAMVEAVKTRRPVLVENRALHKDGTIVLCECTINPRRDATGVAQDVMVVIRDVTRRKKLEADLIEAKERAEKAAAAKTEFLANMSHELRTPLTSVVGYSGLLRRAEGLTATQRLYAERIATSSEALLMVINDILDYSKLEANAVEIEAVPFDVRQWLGQTLGIVESQCQEKGLGLRLEVDEGLPEVLSGDVARLRQVTLNFLSNAVKFTAHGEVALRASGRETQDGGYRLRVEVVDTGIGVSEAKADLIFGRFSQADASTTRVYGGTGLGLAISRRLVELMGGEIGYHSEAGAGATFWFEVPLDFDKVLPVSVAIDQTGPVAHGGRVLLVDDAPANRELLTIILTTLGLEVETASDGVEAVAAVRRGGFDLVLMDVHMPQMDGLAATRLIRQEADEALRTVPVLALTANVLEDQIARCLEAGMDGHLAKPIQVADLAAALEQWLGQGA